MKKIIIGLVGEIASGKSLVSEYIEKKYNGRMYRFSDTFRNILDILGLECNRKNMSELSLSLRETFGEDILAKSMAEKVRNSTNSVVIVDGVRRLEDIKYLKELPEFRLVFIDADIKTRYERIVERGENTDDNKSFEEFEEDHKRDTEVRIQGLKNSASEIVDNNKSIEHVCRQIDELMFK